MQGLVNFEDNQIDPNTGTLRVRAVVQNSDRFLSPGLFVRLRYPLGNPHPALLVPEESLATDQGKRFIYVIGPQDEVIYREVIVGMLTEGKRVIRSGLEPNERVVVTGLQRIRPKAKVDPKPLESSASLVPEEGSPPQKSEDVSVKARSETNSTR